MEFCRRFVFLVFSFICAFCKEDIGINDLFINSSVSNNEESISKYVEEAREKYSNNDIVGKLYISSLSIDVPIVQSDDNDYYLDHDEYKKKNALGSIFLDYRNNIDIDRKILIYGHNSKTIDTEFKKLESFLLTDFYNDSNNKKIVIESLNKKSIYEVSSVFIVSDDFQHMRLSFSQEEWNDHIDWINSQSLYSDFIEYDDEILIMQTCYYKPKDSYLLIVSKKLKEEYY